MKTRNLTVCSMLIAINVVLSIVAPIKLANFKFTFEAFPILVAGLLFGPIMGLLVGGLGSCIYQIFFSGYGLMITTPLWILPHAISGLLCGYYAKKHKFNLNKSQYIFICILCALTTTLLNILAIYLDAIINDYYTFAYVFSNVFIKIIVGIILAIIYSYTIEILINKFNK